ncbi:putative invertase inhibitor [Camellia sinensis]|uniref:putative invertase inhibitor n=1 Tax=Camellia sinensis TaxID=4442 RepID=UPI0010367D15|nr:putative invertase inhibitor [Camellia sinensis]
MAGGNKWVLIYRTISIKLIQSNVTDTNCFIQQLIKNKKLVNPFIQRCLEDCFDLYSDAIPSVEQAMENYDLERFVDANVELSSVMDAATTCEDGFKEKRGVVSPLTKRNGDTFELSAMALSIMGMLQTGSQY